MTLLVIGSGGGGEPEGRRNCIVSYSLYPFNGFVIRWRRPPPLQMRVL